jgi:O-antigen/teichoic acid export membrane protein
LLVESPKPLSTTFLGDVLRLASGTGIAQIVAIVAAPFLTRLYQPEHYGFAAIFVSITSIIGVVACMRYELSIILPAEDREAANLVVASVCVSVLVAATSAGAVWVAQGHLPIGWDETDLAAMIWLVPIAVFLQGVHKALSYWYSRKQQYAGLSVAAVVGAFSSVSGQFGAAFAGSATGAALIIAKVVGQFVAAGTLTVQLLKNSGRGFARNVSVSGIAKGLARYRKFPIYGSTAAVLNSASWQLPVLMLGVFFSPSTVGFYALGFQLLQVPMALIGGSISQVFHQRAGVARREGHLKSLVTRLFEGLTVVCLFPMLALAIVGQDLFIVVFGEKWSEAGVYAQILSFWAYVWFVSSPLSTLFAVLEKQEQGLIMQVIIFCLRLASLSIGAYFGDARTALVMFSLAGVLAYSILLVQIFRLAGVRLSQPARIILIQLAISVPFLLPIALAGVFNLEPAYILAVTLLSGITYSLLQRHRAVELMNLRVSENE